MTVRDYRAVLLTLIEGGQHEHGGGGRVLGAGVREGVPEGAGYSTRALEDMEPPVREWDRWMRAVGEFYDYRDTDGFGRVYQVHRRTIMPAMRACREWGPLLLDERTVVACESQACTDWLGSLLSTTGFWGRAQETVVRAFGLGTGAFAVRIDVGRRLVRVRHYDARMVVPLSWDADGVRERAFVTRCFSRGALLDQLQTHVVGDDGAYRTRTACFDGDGPWWRCRAWPRTRRRGAPPPPLASCGRRCRRWGGGLLALRAVCIHRRRRRGTER